MSYFSFFCYIFCYVSALVSILNLHNLLYYLYVHYFSTVDYFHVLLGDQHWWPSGLLVACLAVIFTVRQNKLACLLDMCFRLGLYAIPTKDMLHDNVCVFHTRKRWRSSVTSQVLRFPRLKFLGPSILGPAFSESSPCTNHTVRSP